MSFNCAYCHINYESTQVCHRVNSLFIEDPILLTLCECCHKNHVKLKEKQEEETRREKEICHNPKCQTVREPRYKFCKECLSGIREAINIIKKTEQLHQHTLSQCNQKYGTQYSIIYPNWDLRFW